MTSSDVTVCQEAMSLLRQEVTLSPGMWSADEGSLTKAERACRRTFDYARRAFLAGHDWGFARRSAAFSTAKPACIRMVDVTDADGATVQWRVDGEIVTAAEGAALSVYTADVEDVTAWPPLARAAFVAYLARELCIPVSGRQEDLKAIDALAERRLGEAKLSDLREGSVADDAAAEVLAMLRESDALSGKAESDGVFAALRRLPTLVKSAAEEVFAMHDWGTPEGFSNLPPLARKAALALAANKAAIGAGATAQHAKVLYDLYQERLFAARVHALETEAPSDPLAREVAALVRPMQAKPAAALPRSFASRVAELVEPARKEVAAAHRWNFARRILPVSAGPGPGGETLVARPPCCVRVERVEGGCGRLAEWSMRGDWIAVRGPARAVVYVEDVEDVSLWPPHVRRALVLRIASEICRQGGEDRFAAEYAKALSDAALQDAREGNPGRAAWGRGAFSSAMRGGRGFSPQYDHFNRRLW